MSLATDLGSVLAVDAAGRAARALFTGMAECENEGRELTELQRIDMASALLAAFDGTSESFASMLTVDATIRTTGATVYRLHEDDGA